MPAADCVSHHPPISFLCLRNQTMPLFLVWKYIFQFNRYSSLGLLDVSHVIQVHEHLRGIIIIKKNCDRLCIKYQTIWNAFRGPERQVVGCYWRHENLYGPACLDFQPWNHDTSLCQRSVSVPSLWEMLISMGQMKAMTEKNVSEGEKVHLSPLCKWAIHPEALFVPIFCLLPVEEVLAPQ